MFETKRLNCHGKLFASAFLLFLFSFYPAHFSEAYSFPFRNIKLYDTVPSVTLSQFKKDKKITFAQFSGKPFVVLFWGADLPEKKKRAIKLLAEIEKNRSFFNSRNIQIISINVLNDTNFTIQEVLQESGSTVPVFIDSNGEAYKNLGIYIMPAMLVVNEQGRVDAGMGYSRDMFYRLRGETEVMLGEKTRAQVEQEIRPPVIIKKRDKIKANLHLNSGYTMLKRGFPLKAMREFKKVLILDPDQAPAHIELGCLYVDMGNIEKAGAALKTGLQLQPDSLRGEVCKAKVDAGLGNQTTAIRNLEALTQKNLNEPEPFFVLGTLYQKENQFNKAIKTYKKAYQLLNIKSFVPNSEN